MTTSDAPRPKAPRPQVVLEVIEKQRITPTMLRVILGGEQFEKLNRNDFTDKYVKLLLPDPASDLVPPYDLEQLRAEDPASLPAKRTYTVRRWMEAKQQIALDFVLHGQGGADGIAAAWADSAVPGDAVALHGAGGGYAPDPDAGFHLLLGDQSALPAISAALEAMAEGAEGLALIQIEHAEDRQVLAHPDGVEVRWLIGEPEDLHAALLDLELPGGDVQVFAHGERGVIKDIRRNLVRERAIPKDRISISAYWARGRIEDQFQAEKREPIGRIDED